MAGGVMFKKMFSILFIIIFLPAASFAKDEPKSEIHFDLPKKDAKEQCTEVQRVLSSCNQVQKKSDHIKECGNIKIINITSYTRNKNGGYDDDWQNDGRIIMNKNGEYVATTRGVDGYFAINDTNDIPYFIFLKNDKELRANLSFIKQNNLLILKITKCSLSKIEPKNQ